MPKNSDVAYRAWNLLRLALLWARKGGVFRRRLMMDLRIIPKFLKSLGHTPARSSIHYGERELSFGDTPIIHVKMHRPTSMRFRIPCINPPVNFDYDFEFDNDDDKDGAYRVDDGRQSLLKGEDDEEEYSCEACEEIISCEDESIDRKADAFIAKFYEQMKLQRQISYLQYNEMLNRGTS